MFSKGWKIPAGVQGTLLIWIMAFLLGRAMILEQFTPFALAFFAVIYCLRPDKCYSTAMILIIGSMSAYHGETGLIAAELLLFYLLQKGIERVSDRQPMYTLLSVFVTAFAVLLMADIAAGEWSWYILLMNAVEALLSFVLCLIFSQALPVFIVSRKQVQLKNEEILCLIILLASVMTGTVGWVVGGMSFEHILSRYLLLLFAVAGGATMGASVGVIIGLILSLANVNAIYQVGMLAFAGLLAGLLKEGKKIGVILGMVLGSSIITLYVDERAAVLASLWETAAASLLFLITPPKLFASLARFVPGTQEHTKSQSDYGKRVRQLIAGRVLQFADIFKQLSASFSSLAEPYEMSKKEADISHFMNAVAEKSCRACWKKTKCWEGQFYQTYQFMSEMMAEVESDPDFNPTNIPQGWQQLCVKSEKVLEHMKQQYAMYRYNQQWKKQIQESRQLVSEQLNGVARVMEDLSGEIQREEREMFVQEEQIRDALEELGLSIQRIDVISLDEGNVHIEMMHQFTGGMDESRKIIAPLLSNLLNESIMVKKETPVGDGYSVVEFYTAKAFEISTGMAGAAKGGELLSGDSFSTLELGNGKFAVAISDGMGNGERANLESKTALMILQQLLQSGMDEKLAIKSVNSVLLLRSSDEMYATIDMALVDLYNADTTFLKIGSTPSFIKRGDEVISIHANNLPVGIIQEIEVDLVHMQLQPGDILIMMTDGIYDAPGYAVNKELWMKRMIQELVTDEPQAVADCLLEKVVRYHQGEIVDDMTVVTAKVENYTPEWATFRWPGLKGINRESHAEA